MRHAHFTCMHICAARGASFVSALKAAFKHDKIYLHTFKMHPFKRPLQNVYKSLEKFTLTTKTKSVFPSIYNTKLRKCIYLTCIIQN
jgi:hypothetical protein